LTLVAHREKGRQKPSVRLEILQPTKCQLQGFDEDVTRNFKASVYNAV